MWRPGDPSIHYRLFCLILGKYCISISVLQQRLDYFMTEHKVLTKSSSSAFLGSPMGGGILLQMWGSVPEKEMEKAFITSQFWCRAMGTLPSVPRRNLPKAEVWFLACILDSRGILRSRAHLWWMVWGWPGEPGPPLEEKGSSWLGDTSAKVN